MNFVRVPTDMFAGTLCTVKKELKTTDCPPENPLCGSTTTLQESSWLLILLTLYPLCVSWSILLQ